VVGVSLRTGSITLRLGIDANDMPVDYIIRLFSWIHQHSMALTKYADSFGGGAFSLAQGLVVFSQHSKARNFSEHVAVKCMHENSLPRSSTSTYPWVVDLEDEKVTTCIGSSWRSRLWTPSRHLRVDAKEMIPRLFGDRSRASGVLGQMFEKSP
jgi:hypothetical protein